MTSSVPPAPVSEDVRLRQEDVTVERRPVDRPDAGDEKLFQDHTIEATEHAEEAVIAKEARVKEELVVKKKVDERVEHVSDKVRSWQQTSPGHPPPPPQCLPLLS